MKNLNRLTTVAFTALVPVLPLLASGFPLYSALLCLTAFFLFFKEVGRVTGPIHLGGALLAATLLGLSLDFPLSGFPFFTLALLVTVVAMIGRLLFMQQLAYTRFPWFEPVLVIASTFLAVAGNIMHPSGWMGWVLPAPPMLMNTGMAAAGVFDVVKIGKLSRLGYAKVGEPAPGFSLPDQDGNTVDLSDYKGKRHVLLIFVRGDWCPGCHIMLRAYQKNYKKFQEKNIVALAIGPDPVGVNREMVMKLGLDYKVLADENQHAAQKYCVQIQENFPNTKFAEGIPLPASFLVDSSGTLRYTSRADRAGECLNPALIFPVIDALT